MDALTALAASLYNAVLKDLPAIHYKKYGRDEVGVRRPDERDIEVRMFPQTWSSTALGFGGIGGQAITSAYTVVITSGDHAAVYFGGRFAYLVKDWGSCEDFRKDLSATSMAAIDRAKKRYPVIVTQRDYIT